MGMDGFRRVVGWLFFILQFAKRLQFLYQIKVRIHAIGEWRHPEHAFEEASEIALIGEAEVKTYLLNSVHRAAEFE